MKIICVSVVIPIYKNIQTLIRGLNSIAQQTVLPLEVIIVNDGGGAKFNDEISELLDKYQFDIKLLTSIKNLGAGGARNLGWKVAKGSYVAFLDSDDAWHPLKLEIQHNFMIQNKSIDISGHKYCIENSEPQWSSYLTNTRKSKKLFFRNFLIVNQFVTPSVMLKKDIGMYFCDRQRYMEDYGLWLIASLKGLKIQMLDDELCCLFKAEFGVSGLSSNMIKMELGELFSYFHLCKYRKIMALIFPFLAVYSLAKFFRRIFIIAVFRKWQ